MTQMMIELSTAESDALRKQARQHLRHPRDQARYLLRLALLGDQPNAKQKQTPTTGQSLATEPVVGVAANP
jgi:hypothetical protein